MNTKEQGLPEMVAEGLAYFELAGDAGDKGYVAAIRKHINQLAEIESVLLAYAMRPPEVSTADAVRWAMQVSHKPAALASDTGGRGVVVPEGWVLVPVDATDAMEAAFDDAHYRADFREEAYAAMLAAAPSPPPAAPAQPDGVSKGPVFSSIERDNPYCED